jgi:S1-C subfamily serine protease
LAFADSDQAFVGQEVMAIGSPFGAGQAFTLTTGVVSGLDRSLQTEDRFSIPELIQTDAAINPGNSGGPLLNDAGQVIGVNSAILSESGSASGVGFAIPSNTVRRIVPYLIERGEYQHSWLGISGNELDSDQREAMNLSDDVHGVMVNDVASYGPAGKAGLQAATRQITTPFGRLYVGGDIITAINDTPIAGMSDLISYLEDNTQPGDNVTLTVLRDGTTKQIDVELTQRPS